MEILPYACFVIAAYYVTTDAAQDEQEDTKRILLNDNYYTIVSQLEALSKEVANISRNTESIAKKVENNSKEMESLKQAKQPSTAIAFAAKLTSSVTGSAHHIYFDDVILNMGNAYKPQHGMFIAPVNGTYEFSLKACSIYPHYIILDIMVQTVAIERLLAGDNVVIDCSSTTVPVHLTAGDDVYVKQAPTGDFLFSRKVEGEPHSNGVLIKAD